MGWDWENDVNFIDYCGLALLIILVVGSFYGTYRLGRWLERRALTPWIADAIEKTFWQGYDFRIQQEAIERERHQNAGA